MIFTNQKKATAGFDNMCNLPKEKCHYSHFY